MTTQVLNHNTSKRVLEQALNTAPETVQFCAPGFPCDRLFTGAEIGLNQSFPVVMDHPKRMRFAMVCRGRENAFKVR